MKPWLVTALAAVLLLRGLIPLGYMPNLSALNEGRFEIVICTGSGSQTIALNAKGTPIQEQQQHGPSSGPDLCPFAAAAAVTLVTFAVLLLLPHRWPSRIGHFRAQPSLVALARFGPAPARAPPLA